MTKRELKAGDLVRIPEAVKPFGDQGRVTVVVPPYCKVELFRAGWLGGGRRTKLVFKVEEVVRLG